MRAAVAGAVVALLVVLCAGIWLGGHPGELPGFLRDRLRRRPRRPHAPKRPRLIQDNYYRSGRPGQLTDSSLRGHGPRPAPRASTTASPTTSPPQALAALQRGDRRPLLGGRDRDRRGQARACTPNASSPARRPRKAGIDAGDVIVSVDGRSIAGESIDAAKERIIGPEGHRGDARCAAAPAAGRVRERPADPRRDHDARSPPRRMRAGRRAQARLRAVRQLHAKAPTGRCAGPCGRSSEKGARGIVLDLRGNGGGLLEEAVLSASIFLPKGKVVVSTDSRTQGHAVYKTVGGNLPPLPIVVLIDREHRLGGGDPHRGAGRRRRRHGGRHPLLRQGRLPAGDRPLQRRRAEADRRRVLHARRGSTWPGSGHPPGRLPARRPARHETRRGAAARPARSSRGQGDG